MVLCWWCGYEGEVWPGGEGVTASGSGVEAAPPMVKVRAIEGARCFLRARGQGRVLCLWVVPGDAESRGRYGWGEGG
jgi:hypothetical protein